MSAFFERLRAALAPDYELLRELASGGMGTVYLVRDVALDCSRAVKVLRPELWTAEASRQFVQEARILADLRHPNIVAVHTVQAKDGLDFYVMDYLEGETLQAHRERHGRLSKDDARKLGRDLLAALSKAHRKGVIHRDVKPANVFLGEDGAVLTDFGIALRLTDQQRSDPNILRGTAAYMAPEQFAGVEADARTDIYAAGMVIYEAFTGIRWEKSSPRDGNWSGARWLVARVLRRSLALKPGDRWPDAGSFRRALWRTRVWPYRFRTLLLTLAGLVAGTIGTAWLVHRGQEGLWPFGPSASVELYVRPFDPTGTSGRAITAGVADALVRKLRGYPDFSVHGPEAPPLFRRNAALVLAGTVSEARESLLAEVRIQATRGGQASVIIVAGESRHLEAFVDALELAVVRLIWNRQNPLDSSLPTGALPRSAVGLAAWLAAERLFADARWGQADSAYTAAEATDSTCWLCYWRHREVQQWLGQDPDPDLAARYLPHLESFPVRYQSLMRAVELPLRARLDSLRATTRESRDFFPAWFQLADELYHRGPLVGFSRADAVEAFQMAARLRPAFGPTLEHLAWALTAEGDSSGAWAAWSQLKALGEPSDPFTLAIRALLRVGYASRFLDSAAAGEVLRRALGKSQIQHFEQLAAGPRYLATFDAPDGAVSMGMLFAKSKDRVLQRSGLIAAALGNVSSGQLGQARVEFARLDDRFDVPDLGLMEPELDGVLMLLGREPSPALEDWPDVAQALGRYADTRANPGVRRRAAWILVLAARRLGGVDTAQYRPVLAEEPAPRPLGRLLAADGLARRGHYRDALVATDTLGELEAPALSGPVPVDPFYRTVLHVLRAEWLRSAGESDDAARELVWYQNNDVSGLPTRDPQVADVDWAFGTFARWWRAPLLEQEDRREEACRAYRDVARLWSRGDPPFRARADSAARRLVRLHCKEAA
ncbi:MAG TPA: serine/threonine-protein kinase [Gemmatimonadales bacterium]|nr:serine/threonine-protein kinase [Gemmatimonadales bacterium]